jgi:hypothetical protein
MFSGVRWPPGPVPLMSFLFLSQLMTMILLSRLGLVCAEGKAGAIVCKPGRSTAAVNLAASVLHMFVSEASVLHVGPVRRNAVIVPARSSAPPPRPKAMEDNRHSDISALKTDTVVPWLEYLSIIFQGRTFGLPASIEMYRQGLLAEQLTGRTEGGQLDVGRRSTRLELVLPRKYGQCKLLPSLALAALVALFGLVAVDVDVVVVFSV